MLDRANSGPEPSAEILRAIRHGVAAGAWRVAGRASGRADCFSRADGHSLKARLDLHQATASAISPYRSGRKRSFEIAPPVAR